MKLKPNHLTISSLILTIIGVVMSEPASTALFITALLMDALDGRLARREGLVTRSGGELDSIIDKIVEGLIIMYYTINAGINGSLMVTMSIIISYAKLRTNTRIKTIFDRAQRMTYIIAMFTLLSSHLSVTLITYYALSIIALTQVLNKAWFA